MIAIFYNKKTLNDTLVININNKEIKEIKHCPNYTIGYDFNHQISFINIFNFSKHLVIKEGFVKPNDEIVNIVKKITNVDLKEFPLKNKIIVGQILEVSKIPNTHLHYCTVDIGESKLPIVCGANNVQLGIKVIVAMDGSILPNGKEIKKGKLLNFESCGMLCSQTELAMNFSKFNSQGIVILPKDYLVGKEFDELYTN